MADTKKNIVEETNKQQDAINKVNFFDGNNPYQREGFQLPPSISADSNGLPYNKIKNNRTPYRIKRNIVTWFVPDFGVVKMYVNPQGITYSHKKIINPTLTKGGYTLQYWGEALTELSINGTTGSSGIEGINVLYEIYRAEQYAMDTTGLLTSAMNSASNPLNNIIGGFAGGKIESLVSSYGGVLGPDSPNNSLLSSNLNSLAKSAFSVEMYYSGWVYRGFFTSMTINEKADNFLFDYTLNFTATQRRGYRVNYFPWHRSAKDGPSEWNTPYSMSK